MWGRQEPWGACTAARFAQGGQRSSPISMSHSTARMQPPLLSPRRSPASRQSAEHSRPGGARAGPLRQLGDWLAAALASITKRRPVWWLRPCRALGHRSRTTPAAASLHGRTATDAGRGSVMHWTLGKGEGITGEAKGWKHQCLLLLPLLRGCCCRASRTSYAAVPAAATATAAVHATAWRANPGAKLCTSCAVDSTLCGTRRRLNAGRSARAPAA